MKQKINDLELQNKLELIKFLSSQLTDTRWQKIKEKSLLRTKYITVILEDIFQSHNMSAAVRSCEGFGIQQVHVIEDRNKYVVNQKVVKGAADWVDIVKHNNILDDNSLKESSFENTRACFEKLRSDGYRIIATTPHEKDKLIYDLPLEAGKPGKIALVFGTEETGLSKYAMENVDEYVKIPMYGFTESFNISVSVAICLYELTKILRSSNINWQLSEQEIIDLQLEWLRKSLPHSELLEKYYIEKRFDSLK